MLPCNNQEHIGDASRVSHFQASVSYFLLVSQKYCNLSKDADSEWDAKPIASTIVPVTATRQSFIAWLRAYQDMTNAVLSWHALFPSTLSPITWYQLPITF